MREMSRRYGLQEALKTKPRITVGKEATVVFEKTGPDLSTAHGIVNKNGKERKIIASGRTPTAALYVFGVDAGISALRRGVFSPRSEPISSKTNSEYNID